MDKFRINNDKVMDSQNRTVALIHGEKIKDSSNRSLCSFRTSGGDTKILDDSNRTLGILKNDKILDSSNRTIGTLKDAKSIFPHPDDRVAVALFLVLAA